MFTSGAACSSWLALRDSPYSYQITFTWARALTSLLSIVASFLDASDSPDSFLWTTILFSTEKYKNFILYVNAVKTLLNLEVQSPQTSCFGVNPAPGVGGCKIENLCVPFWRQNRNSVRPRHTKPFVRVFLCARASTKMASLPHYRICRFVV